jgi:hypothetical protein
MHKKARLLGIDILAGILLIIGGTVLILGKLNLGALLATLGLLIELIKEIADRGL